MATGAHAMMELFRAVKRETELHREILTFSVSQAHATIHISGYRAEIDGANAKYYRHLIRPSDLTELDGKEKWTVYKFTKNVYDHWMPMHFKKICSAIDQIPASISFFRSQSELRFSEPTALLRDISVYNIAR